LPVEAGRAAPSFAIPSRAGAEAVLSLSCARVGLLATVETATIMKSAMINLNGYLMAGDSIE
jgi:hypothetical protein